MSQMSMHHGDAIYWLFAILYRLYDLDFHWYFMYAYFFDYSAISVLLGEAWKSLPIEEREAYSTKAKVLADEQKKIHPDCWKRKKTVANNSIASSNANVNQSGNAGEMTNKTTSTSHNLINSISTSHQKIAPPTNVTLPLPVSLPPPVIPILSETAQRVVGSSQSTVDIV